MLVDHVYEDAKLERAATRDGYGQGLVLAGREDERVVVLCADLSESTRSEEFAREFPKRFIEVGVAEQNMASVASGMAAAGKIPFISSYAVFSPGRNWEQIRTTICYNQANVKIGSTHAGVTVGADGATHQALEDIALTRTLPHMTVIVPCDSVQARMVTVAAVVHNGPVYLRFSRASSPVFTSEDASFEIGKAQTFRDGSDVTVIACGPLVYDALLAAEALAQKGVSVEVINLHTIKPLDEAAILRSVEKTGAVVTVEEHQKAGGMGSAVVEFLATNHAVPVEMIGIDDRFGESGEPQELLEMHGLTASAIEDAAQRVAARV
jgi:transketolase